ncbi:hypothetical protein HMPREF0044_0773 [Gleimia coleocanis DSM 15436]|uniref:Aminoglycoside phosphotransferase domain-containing protein n=1 Tax=Gleimia coleocanis DSM 15436 TaxID=525245 RepID=C0W130_9ACTO|nr:phosphotransferase [Gleimia coleocanis]EEH63754.1 hypothetical protein HMPREF0044_0773 [Gleimia coleocanis DSM 15436]
MENSSPFRLRAYLTADENCFTVVGMKALTPLSLTAHACAVFPNFNVVALTQPSENDGTFMRQGVIDSRGDHWVIVAPLTDAAGAELEAQTTLLHFLHRAWEKGLVPFDVPVPAAHTRANATVPLFIHTELSGEVADQTELEESATLAGSMGRALAALHSLPAEIIERTGLPVYSAADCRERLRSQLSEGATAWSLPQNLYHRWEMALDDDALFNFATTPIHANVDVDAFLSINGVVTGMKDFGAACLGDPAEDLATLLTVDSQEVAEEFIRAYMFARKNADIHLVTRAYLLSEFAVLRWLLHGLRLQDATIVAEAKEMLQELAEILGDEPLVPEHAEIERPEFNLLDVAEAVVAAAGTESASEVDPEALTVVLNEVLPLSEKLSE